MRVRIGGGRGSAVEEAEGPRLSAGVVAEARGPKLELELGLERAMLKRNWG